MNIYFVFEGKTESIVYRAWLSVLLPQFTAIEQFYQAQHHHYFYQSNMGVPDCYNVVANAIQDIHSHPHYNFLVLVIDADRSSVEEKIVEAYQKIDERLQKNDCLYKTLPRNCELKVFVQQVCIETWFLGNKKFFVRNAQSEILRNYVAYFNVSTENPELLASEFQEGGDMLIFGYPTKALFHNSYFREIFKERMNGFAYQKGAPREVNTPAFLQQLLKRVEENPSHLKSFQSFIAFCQQLAARA